MRKLRPALLIASLLGVLSSLLPGTALAMPAFARQYNISCAACHSAFPRLNEFGEFFADQNFRLPNWRDTTVDTGDAMLALPKSLPIAVRAQSFVQLRDGDDINPATGPTGNDASFDFQAPYLVKLLASAPLSDHITFYFYGILAEKGGNGEVVLEDAWFQHDDLFGTGVSAMLGQFQVSDLMFPREVRLTFQDFYAYRAAGITYDRGVILSRGFGPVDLAVGAVNGNGIEQNFSIDSPGYRRPDRLFDNDSDKSLFGRAGFGVKRVNVGLFGLVGKQRSAAGAAGVDAGARNTDKWIAGLDLSGNLAPNVHWFAQGLWNSWDNFLDAAPTEDYQWFGGFAGLDYIRNERWTYSLLYNHADAGDFDDTDTLFKGINMRSVSVGAAYYFMRNVKAVVELNADLLKKDPPGPPWVGHQSREHSLLVGFDAAF